MVDYIADYLENIRDRRVFPEVFYHFDNVYYDNDNDNHGNDEHHHNDNDNQR